MGIEEAVLEKIKKLLALAGEGGFTNDNRNEADAAFKKAAMLMEKHGLAIADIDMVSGKVSNIMNVTIRQGQAKYKIWANGLASVLSKCFDCKVILTGVETQAFVGTKADVEMAIWYYNFLKIRIARAASDKFKGVKDQKTYGLGCVMTLRERLESIFIKKREEVRTSNTTALVVVKKQEIAREFQKLYPNARQQSKRQNVNLSSREVFEQGMEDGRKMAINQPIEGKASQAIR